MANHCQKEVAVIQLNLQAHILIQRKMPVWYHRSNTNFTGGRFSPRWLFTSCHDRGSNPRPLDWGAGTIPLCHSDLHESSTMCRKGRRNYLQGDHIVPTYKHRMGEIESNNNCGSNRNVICLLYTSPSPRDKRQSRMPSSA